MKLNMINLKKKSEQLSNKNIQLYSGLISFGWRTMHECAITFLEFFIGDVLIKVIAYIDSKIV